jgi:hypothetical protein
VFLYSKIAGQNGFQGQYFINSYKRANQHQILRVARVYITRVVNLKAVDYHILRGWRRQEGHFDILVDEGLLRHSGN